MADLFENMLEAAPGATLLVGETGSICFANRAAAALFGFEPRALLARPLGLVAPMLGNLSEGPRERTLLGRTQDGAEIPIDLTLTPLSTADGRFTLVSIHERRASDLHFRTLAESLPLMVWTCRADGLCDYLSPQWVEYTGIPASQQLGFRWLEQLHPDDVELTSRRWAVAAASGGTFDTEFRIRRQDGGYRWFKTRAIPIIDASGAITQWIGSNTDVQELRDSRDLALRLNTELESRVDQRTDELRTTNAKLATTAAQLQAAQRLTRVGSWEFDLSTGRVTWSDELFRILGRPAEVAPPTFVEQESLYSAESWVRLSAAVARSIATGEGYELTLRSVRHDGTQLTTIARAETVRGARGEVIRLVGTLQDITERELASARLRQLNDRLQLATSAARMGVWDWDVATAALVWDEAMYHLYGTSAGSFAETYDAWLAMVHADDRGRVERAITEAVAGGAAFNTTFRIVRPDGQIRHIRAESTNEREPITGATLRMVGVNLDITVEREAELALQHVQAFQSSILAHAGSAIIATDLEGTIVTFNPAAEVLTGYTAPELIGKASPAVFHVPAEVDRRKQALERELGVSIATPFDVFILRSRDAGADVSEWTYLRKDGSHVAVLLTITSIRNAAAQIIGYLGVAVDLTQRKQAELELRELNQLLADRSAQREVLLQEVHHRVKNNLQVVSSLVNMQVRRMSDAGARNELREMQMRIHAIALIHEQLYQAQNYARIDIQEYARTLTQNIVSTGDHRGMTLELAVATMHLSIDDAIPCGLILNELVVNALKHAFPNQRRGTIRVAFDVQPDGRAELVVEDDGIGLPEPFDPTGMGSLGMRLVTTLARQLGGELAAGPSRSRGARLSVTFPITKMEASAS